MRMTRHIHALVLDHFFQIVFFHDGNAIGIAAACQNRWIAAASNVGNLRCGGRDNMKFGMIAENDARSTHQPVGHVPSPLFGDIYVRGV